jgi:hypothetical protein
MTDFFPCFISETAHAGLFPDKYEKPAPPAINPQSEMNFLRVVIAVIIDYQYQGCVFICPIPGSSSAPIILFADNRKCFL